MAAPILTAISGVSVQRPFTSSESVFREIPMHTAARVMVKFKGLITSSKSTTPGCVGFRFVSFILILPCLIVFNNLIVLAFFNLSFFFNYSFIILIFIIPILIVFSNLIFSLSNTPVFIQ